MGLPILSKVIIISVKVTVKFNANKFNDKIRNMCQKLTEEIKKDISQFVPYRSGELDRSAYIRDAGNNRKEIIWHTPYSRFQFYGRVMRDSKGRAFVGKGGRKPYISNKMRYSKEIHPKATAFWTIEAKKQYLKKWAEQAKEFFRD